MGVEVGVQMWAMLPEGRVWVLWFKPRFGSGFGVSDGSVGVGGGGGPDVEGCAGREGVGFVV